MEAATHNQSNGIASDDAISPDDIIIAVMGMTGAGKTSFISRCVGRDVGIGHGLSSKTQDVTVHSLKRRGRTVWLIDTPGFDDTSRSDVSILNNIAFWLSHAYRAKPARLLSGLIYIHSITETRVVGTAAKNIRMMKTVCGIGGLSVLWLASSKWDCVDHITGMDHERLLTSDPAYWGELIKHGATTWRHYDTKDTALRLIDDIITRDQRFVLAIQREMVDENLDVDQTTAGRQLGERVREEQKEIQERLENNAKKLENKLAQQQSAAAEVLRARQETYRAELAEKDLTLEAMHRNMEQLRREKAIEFENREREFARQRQEQNEKIARLDREIQELRAARLSAEQQQAAPQQRPSVPPRPNAQQRPNVQQKPDRQQQAPPPYSVYDNYNANANQLALAAQQQQQQQQRNEAIAMINAELALRALEEQTARQMQQAMAFQEMAFQQTLAATTGNMFYSGGTTNDVLYQGATQLATQAVASACVLM